MPFESVGGVDDVFVFVFLSASPAETVKAGAEKITFLILFISTSLAFERP